VTTHISISNEISVRFLNKNKYDALALGVTLLARFACLLLGVGFMIRAANVLPLSVFRLVSFIRVIDHPTLSQLKKQNVKNK